jgi:hypothetical protein
VADVFNHTLLVTTPQGWLRRWDDQGIVSLGDWRGAAEILPKLQATVISIEDIEGDWAVAEKWAGQTSILIVTQDKEGLYGLQSVSGDVCRPDRLTLLDLPAPAMFCRRLFIRYQKRDRGNQALTSPM